MPTDDGMRAVELVEVEVVPTGRRSVVPTPGAVSDGEPSTGPMPPVERWTLVRRWWPVALVLVLLVVTAQLVLDARARGRVAARSSVPGVIAPLEGPLEVLGAVDPTNPWQIYGFDRGDGVWIAPVLDPDGARSVQAIDPGTGETVWRTTLAGAGDTDDDGEHGWWDLPGCWPADSDGGPLTVCQVTDNEVTGRQDTGLSLSPQRTRLMVLDATTGAMLADRAGPVSSSLAVIGSLAVQASYDDAGDVLVTATDPVSGDPRWTFRAPPGDPSAIDPEMAPSVWVDHGVLVVSTLMSTTWLLGPDGTVLADAPAAGDGARQLFVTRTGSAASSQGTAVDLLDKEGSTLATLPGEPLWLSVDDGSLPGTVLVGTPQGATPAVTAVDAATGEILWSGPGPVQGALLLDGLLYGQTDGQVQALDAATGEVQWQADLDSPVESSWSGSDRPLTDGRRLYLSTGIGQDRALVGFDLADGRETWRSPYPDGVVEVLQLGPRSLAGWSGDGTGDYLLIGSRPAP